MNLQEVANRRLEVEKANIEDQKRKKIQESKAEMEQQVRGIQNEIRAVAIILPPLPPLILGLVVFGIRCHAREPGGEPEPARLTVLSSCIDNGLGHRIARGLSRIGTMKELHKTLIFVAVALLLTGAAVVRLPGRSDRGRWRSTTRASRSSPTSRTRSPAPTWRWSTTTRPPPPHRGSRSSSRTASGSSRRTTITRPTPRTASPRPPPESWT